MTHTYEQDAQKMLRSLRYRFRHLGEDRECINLKRPKGREGENKNNPEQNTVFDNALSLVLPAGLRRWSLVGTSCAGAVGCNVAHKSPKNFER